MDILNFIDGQHLPADGASWLDNIEPATGKSYGRIARSNQVDIDRAVAAAQRAFPGWSKTPIEKRTECLNRLADQIKAHFNLLVEAESKDNGKPVSLAAHVDIPRAEKNLRFYASAAQQFLTEAGMAAGADQLHYVHRKPLGVVGIISPWNLPLYLFTWKVAPALAMGNCVVGKPSEITPATAFLLSKWITEAGFPPGVFNIVNGLGGEAGEALVKHPDIKAISFTGGTATGKHIAQAVAGTSKKTTFELGGKNPAIIFDDCDFDLTLKAVVRSGFANQGQICLCSSRYLIHESIYDRFRDALVKKVTAMQPGDPSMEQTKMGAVVSADHLKKIESFVHRAVELGGNILCGGKSTHPTGDRCSAGYFMEPTVIEGLDAQCEVNQQEIFGPVVTLQSFKSEEEAIELANGTEYGLACTIWTENLRKAHRVAAEIDSGIAWVNCWLERDLRMPFGGVKSSGAGREGGTESLRFFSEPQNVCIQIR